MNQAQHRAILVAFALVTAAAFAACGSVDDRKVTRGPDVPSGGDGSGNTGNFGNGGAGNEPGAGGSDSRGGDGTTNPFGGDTFVGGAPPVVEGPPSVVEVDPQDDASDVSPTANVSLLFSEGLDESTVTGEHVYLLDGDQEVDGTLGYEGVVASFNPASRLSLLATYDVNVTTGVTDTSGEALIEPFTSKFTVRDGEWERQAGVAVNPQAVGEHASGIDAHGNLLIAYTRATDPTNPSSPRTVAARWVRAITNVPGPEVILEENGATGSSIRLAVDAEGNAVAAWQSVDASGTNVIRARRFLNGEWERQPQTVRQETAQTPMDSANSSAVAIGGGQVVVAWSRYYYLGSTPYYVIEYSSTALDGAWSAPLSPYTVTNNAPKYENFDSVQATLDARGTAIVTFVWNTNEAYEGVYFARRAVGSEWESPIKIPASTASSSYAAGPVLASDGDGAMAVWLDYTNFQYRLRASRYTRARQFAEPVEIGDPNVTTNARIQTNGGLATNGTSYWVTWTQGLGNSQNVYAKRYDIAGSAWDAEPTLVSDGVSSSEFSAIGVDAHGNALVAYDQRAANNSLLVMGARYVASSGRWSDATPLTETGTYFQRPLLAVAANGVAGVMFSSEQNEGMPAAVNQAGLYRIFK